MFATLEKRADGSLAFFIDGDLQFDSTDERIYHEGLVKPALSVASRRVVGDSLRALVLGGGDGLTARELLKCARVTAVDLVDFSAEVLQLARTEFAPYNEASLLDPRVLVHIEDAKKFIASRAADGTKYDIIVSDFTAPHDADGAQLHAVEFYETLRALLTPFGTLAVNCASPSGTPQAYWSIFNSILTAGLNPRPLRVVIPSFAEQGYGPDWGFMLAAPTAVTADEISDPSLRASFTLPKAIMPLQAKATPGKGESDVLVQYLFNPEELEINDAETVDTLALDLSLLSSPPAETRSYLLPQVVRHSLANVEQDALLDEMLELMPALRRDQTREMVAEFVARPYAFLAPINLGELVNELLKRAAELPGKLVEELAILKQKIVEFSSDREQIMGLGLRSLAVMALVVIMGNLMYPDSVYAKGTLDANGHAALDAGRVGGGRVGDRGWNRGGWGGTYWNNGVYAPPLYRRNRVIDQTTVIDKNQTIKRNNRINNGQSGNPSPENWGIKHPNPGPGGNQ